jgi:hypothetical protein
MQERRRTVQHLWNRLMAAMLFVMGAALGTAAPSETEETRLSRAQAGQFETGAGVKLQLAQSPDVSLDGAGADRIDGQLALTPAILRLPDRPAAAVPAIPLRPVWRRFAPARDGDTRAPPSA